MVGGGVVGGGGNRGGEGRVTSSWLQMGWLMAAAFVTLHWGARPQLKQEKSVNPPKPQP